jgi:hypothetical protein
VQDKDASRKAAEEYIPVDFDAYSIADKATLESPAKAGPLEEKERIWRISSLTTYVDADTKILLLPIPESKRKVKIQDTKYSLGTYSDLTSRHEAVENEL